MGETAQITCSNLNCQAPNPETGRFCQRCRTPLPKRYLWVVGEGIEAQKPGKLLAQRFLQKDERILLDTQPGVPLAYAEEIPDWIVPYLRLFPYQLHIPQVYGKLPPHKKGRNKEIWLLEQAPIGVVPNSKLGKSPVLGLKPELTAVWQNATAMRQLNWLWQIAQLWQPMMSEGVAVSLLNPKLLRVEGQLVRLLELRLGLDEEATLKKLGQLWQQWIPGANREISGFLAQLCQQMIQENLVNSEELIAQLDQALDTIGRSQSRSIQVITLTDTGPTRQRNEDACYPPPSLQGGKPEENLTSSESFVIVCDGIGGHEGGNVASHLAIETVQKIEEFPLSKESNHLDLITQLENAVCQANDLISQRNDKEGRSERQRMGTTLVMAKGKAHEIYITHIGDSRAYWITPTGCHQVTVDDDLASREVRLGYALYRETLQQIGSGALVQALGMSSSANLHPTVQRFIIDEDCIFLLCSDGLSDNDRVEQNWDREILPVLEKKVDLATAAAKLVEIANNQNGHDNVTVGLVYVKVSENQRTNQPETTLKTEVSHKSVEFNPSLVAQSPKSYSSQMKTPLMVSNKPKPSLLPLLLSIAVLLGLGGMLAYILIPAFHDWLGERRNKILPQVEQVSLDVSPSPSPLVPVKGSNSANLWNRGAKIKVSIPQIANPNEKSTLLLYKGYQPEQNQVIGSIPNNSILVIEGGNPKDSLEKEPWLFLKVCSVPQISETSQISQVPTKPTRVFSPITLVKPGQGGWIKQSDIEPFKEIPLNEIERKGECVSQSKAVTPILEKKHLAP